MELQTVGVLGWWLWEENRGWNDSGREPALERWGSGTPSSEVNLCRHLEKEWVLGRQRLGTRESQVEGAVNGKTLSQGKRRPAWWENRDGTDVGGGPSGLLWHLPPQWMWWLPTAASAILHGRASWAYSSWEIQSRQDVLDRGPCKWSLANGGDSWRTNVSASSSLRWDSSGMPHFIS